MMIGGAGDGCLLGVVGGDLIVSVRGSDRISIRPGQGFDRVAEFTDGQDQDRIVLGGINFGQLSIQQRNNDVLISREDERLLLLQNTRVGHQRSGLCLVRQYSSETDCNRRRLICAILFAAST
ncbi:hypothetical protein [Vacuolonema iberomarrocanum]|uniref:hypothetical protein n=1 Tax=Vacuolonema iberomarrocanum TaxID=3454632 RepID=UPI0019E11925|nr:hypothetical protein [filamentous cyanobacterium LEGE 07170]